MARPGQEAVTTLKGKLPGPNLSCLKEGMHSKQQGFPLIPAPHQHSCGSGDRSYVSVKDSDAGMLNTGLV